MKPGLMLGLVWLVWAVSWYGAAWWSGHTVGRPAPGSQIAYRAITSAGAILLFVPFRRHHDHWILWHLSAAAAWTAVGATAMGFLFAWWARIYLGRLWSGSITRKAQHRIVETGPYGIVRHPIYTGLILAVWASAVLKATILAFPGALAMTGRALSSRRGWKNGFCAKSSAQKLMIPTVGRCRCSSPTDQKPPDGERLVSPQCKGIG